MCDGEKNERRADALMGRCLGDLWGSGAQRASDAREAARLLGEVQADARGRGDGATAERAREKGVACQALALSLGLPGEQEISGLEDRMARFGLADHAGKDLARSYRDRSREALRRARALAATVPSPVWDRFDRVMRSCVSRCEWAANAFDSYVRDYDGHQTFVAQCQAAADHEMDVATKKVPVLVLVQLLVSVVPCIVLRGLLSSGASVNDAPVGVCLMVSSVGSLLFVGFGWWASEKTRLGCLCSIVVFVGTFLLSALAIGWVLGA